MSIFTKKKTIAVHDGSFHTDDVFACATLMLAFKGHCKIVRTRDQAVIDAADFAVDVGGSYDPEINRFDHHQIGGAGERENGIPYASFGLVWKKYGAKITGSDAVAERIDTAIVQPIDAPDNGVDIVRPIHEGVGMYGIHTVITSFLPTWKESDVDVDEQFEKAVELAQGLLAREIRKATDYIDAAAYVVSCYQQSPDKRVVVVDAPIGRMQIISALMEFPEPLYVVYPDRDDGKWSVAGMIKEFGSFGLRKDLPEAWAGLRDEELQNITGVQDAVFCHTKRFLAVAKTKAGAQRLAGLALNE